MPRDYQRSHNNPYLLPHYLYKAVKYTVMDYDRMNAAYQDVLHASPPPPEGMPGSSETSSPTEDIATRREALGREVDCINRALQKVPAEYRRGVFNEARYGGGYPTDAARSTYAFWKQRFMFWVAKNMRLI